ncbi:PREDICTED: cation-dependent mannose-6-phosphate receptor-like [Priapulus caudatus]|uniref:Cation-dependent mannose-6-phosphate receptor-like n=1 Tax=Priapulus caudatus TaxID=37621 RepID=A0ABM1EMU7_PRICU|nr:PREDICTED: cation-dependent mannose-6-phosphate receptor-like [Priapulus caudatus]
MKQFYAYFVLMLAARAAGDCTLTVSSQTQQEFLNNIKTLQGKRLSADTQKYNFSIGICTSAVTDKAMEKAGAVQMGKGNKENVTLGRFTMTEVKGGHNWVMLSYKGGAHYRHHCNNSSREAHIMIICDQHQTEPVLTVLDENRDKDTNCYYLFEISSSEVCNNEQAPSDSQGLSGGSIFVIIFFTVVGIYLLVGISYQRFVMGARGMEQMPNLSFWQSLGNLIADGCEWAFRSHRNAEYRHYESPGGSVPPAAGTEEEDKLYDQDDHLLPM